MTLNELQELFRQVKELRSQDKTLPYLEKDLLNVVILQNSMIIKLLEQINERL